MVLSRRACTAGAQAVARSVSRQRCRLAHPPHRSVGSAAVQQGSRCASRWAEADVDRSLYDTSQFADDFDLLEDLQGSFVPINSRLGRAATRMLNWSPSRVPHSRSCCDLLLLVVVAQSVPRCDHAGGRASVGGGAEPEVAPEGV